jgi:VIT1/CCC1 family predicted Fe2+/Mn2+ transporter
MDQRTGTLDAALSPFERASESVFGILMAISVTAAFEITVGKDIDTRELMIAALGCNLAWGLIDGAMYLMQQQFERYRDHRTALEGGRTERPSFWPAREFAVAGLICLIVFASTFPLVVPFIFMQEQWLAIRASHAVAVVMLFWLGWGLGRWSGASPLASGVIFAAVGTVLAVACVALGG